MLSAYFETRFAVEGADLPWPREFAIITAYATTGETWTQEQNENADRELTADLDRRGVRLRRVTGYSPSTGHAEPGWAAAVDFDTAIEIGRAFRQDAIYFVKEDALYVSKCATPQLIRVGSFGASID